MQIISDWREAQENSADLDFGSAWNRQDVCTLREHPCECHLSARCVMTSADVAELLHESKDVREVLRRVSIRPISYFISNG